MVKDRVFTSKDEDDKEVKLRLKSPTQKLLSKGDFVYRQHFSNAIRAGLMTNAEAQKILKDREIWNEDKEVEANDMREEIRLLGNKFSDGLSKEDGMDNYQQIKSKRIELSQLTALYRSVADNTAEQLASEERTKFFASECVVYDTSGQRAFKNVDDLESKLNTSVGMDSYREMLISGYERILGIEVPTETGSEFPEDSWFDDKMAKEEQSKKESKPATKKKTRKRRTTKKDKVTTE